MAFAIAFRNERSDNAMWVPNFARFYGGGECERQMLFGWSLLIPLVSFALHAGRPGHRSAFPGADLRNDQAQVVADAFSVDGQSARQFSELTLQPVGQTLAQKVKVDPVLQESFEALSRGSFREEVGTETLGRTHSNAISHLWSASHSKVSSY